MGAEADWEALSQLGIGADVRLPTESTIHRTLAGLDADDLDARVGSWMATRMATVAGRPVIAVDDKSLRGAVIDGSRPHLLSALGRSHQVVVGQRAVADKGSEIPALKDLLAPMELAGVVVTADALPCQRDTATWLVGRGGLRPGGQGQPQAPAGPAQGTGLAWGQGPGHTYQDRRHGRRMTRTVTAVQLPAWVDWPAAAQVLQVRRTRIINGRRHVEVVDAVSPVPMDQAQPRIVAAWIQGHWAFGVPPARGGERAALGSRRHLRPRSPPTPRRLRTPSHGDPAQHRNQPAPPARLDQHPAVLRHHARDSRRPITLLAES